MSPLKSQNTKFVLMGLAAVAATAICYYLVQQSSPSATTARAKTLDSDDGLADDDTVQAKGSSTTKSTATASKAKTLTKDDEKSKMDEKELHARIEELDKKGKTFFKDKQVGHLDNFNSTKYEFLCYFQKFFPM